MPVPEAGPVSCASGSEARAGLLKAAEGGQGRVWTGQRVDRAEGGT